MGGSPRPMAKDKTLYTCSECASTSPRWLGKCPSCGAWNTLIETVPEAAPGKNRLSNAAGQYAGLAQAQAVMPWPPSRPPTWSAASGVGELDRVLGGGIVEGGVVLIGGDPGIGKSRAAAAGHGRAAAPRPAHAVRDRRGERRQVALRSRRLGLDGRR